MGKDKNNSMEEKAKDFLDKKRHNYIISERIQEERLVTEKIDDKGVKWKKVYFGFGKHFQNWLDQMIEIFGEENIEIEKINTKGFKCIEDEMKEIYRIWVKEDKKIKNEIQNK